MSWLSELFRGGKNPANAAQPYLNQVPDVGHQAYDPFIQQGQQAGNALNEKFMSMMSDPQGFLAQLQSGYKPSDAYKFKSDELQKGMGAAAAQGGVAGTPYHQMELGKQADQLLSGDMQQYLQNALGIQNTGLTGQQDIYNKGFQASGSLADMLGGNLNQQGSLGFQGQSQQNKNQMDMMKMFAQALGGAGGMAMNPMSLFGHQMWG